MEKKRSSNWFIAVVLKFCCTLESPGESFPNPMPKPNLITNKSNFLDKTNISIYKNCPWTPLRSQVLKPVPQSVFGHCQHWPQLGVY